MGRTRAFSLLIVFGIFIFNSKFSHAGRYSVCDLSLPTDPLVKPSTCSDEPCAVRTSRDWPTLPVPVRLTFQPDTRQIGFVLLSDAGRMCGVLVMKQRDGAVLLEGDTCDPTQNIMQEEWSGSSERMHVDVIVHGLTVMVHPRLPYNTKNFTLTTEHDCLTTLLKVEVLEGNSYFGYSSLTTTTTTTSRSSSSRRSSSHSSSTSTFSSSCGLLLALTSLAALSVVTSTVLLAAV